MTVTDYTVSVAKPEFVANRGGRTVAEAVNGFVSSAARGLVGGIRLDIATAYFNLVAISCWPTRSTKPIPSGF